MKKISDIWVKNESGILVPSGNVSESSDRTKTNFIQIKARAQEIEQLYINAGIKMSPTCGLAKLISNAKILSDRWLVNDWGETSIIHAFYALQLQRIADAILPLANYSDSKRYLNGLIAGEIDFFKRGSSYAKDTLWELELWSLLCERCHSAKLQDPPDIILNISGKTIGIACKKIYSEANLEKVLSQAVGQVEDEYDVGVAAINIDELIPEDTVLKVRTEREMALTLHGKCDDFLQRHERHFRKYLSKGRLVAVLVSVHVIADVEEWNVPFNNSRQSTVWTIPGLPIHKEALLDSFEEILL